MARVALTVLAATLALGGPSLGQNAAPSKDATKDATQSGSPPHRYRFSHSPEGVLRLDNQTGEVVLCRALNGGWVCNPTPQETAVLKVELQRKDDEVKKLAGQFVQLKDDVSRASDATAADGKSLKDEITKLQAAIAKLQGDVAALTGKVAEAGKPQGGITQEERQSMVSRLALLEQDNGGLKGSLKRLEDENARLKKQMADAPKPPDLEPAITQAIAANDALKRELDRLKSDNKSLSDKLASLELGKAAMQAEIDALKPPVPLPQAEVPADKRDELKLPSREDMDRARAALTDAWRKLMEMIGQMQKDMLGGKDNPPVRL
jgi:predicted  nucleic acid-binding Zn-ribbon protein